MEWTCRLDVGIKHYLNLGEKFSQKEANWNIVGRLRGDNIKMGIGKQSVVK